MINKEALADIDPDILLADGFDDAFIGLTDGIGACRVVYDSGKCIEILVARGNTFEEASDWFSFNVAGAYMGESTPIFVDAYMCYTDEREEPNPNNT